VFWWCWFGLVNNRTIRKTRFQLTYLLLKKVKDSGNLTTGKEDLPLQKKILGPLSKKRVPGPLYQQQNWGVDKIGRKMQRKEKKKGADNLIDVFLEKNYLCGLEKK